VKDAGVNERKTQLFIRAVTNGVISERDLLLSYGIGEFYNEMSLFIEEMELKKKNYEEAKRRIKH
jgi:hypothetical protein